MSRGRKITAFALLLVAVAALAVSYLANHGIAVLNPQGVIATKERNLMITTVLLGLIVVVPVYIMTFTIAWKYRESNTKAKYRPDWDHNIVVESIWWGLPTAIIVVLSVITWNSSHDLDPFKSIASGTKPLTIQVIALDWKWLFIYPEQHIATVNYLQFPEKTPLNFEITADAPMNSFWIPQLGGQIYAMPGMSTELHLAADTAGSYRGSSANLSGRGFAAMNFTATSSTDADFWAWVNSVQQSPKQLSMDEYSKLVKPGEPGSPLFYADSNPNLYDTVLIKYMGPLANTRGINDVYN